MLPGTAKGPTRLLGALAFALALLMAVLLPVLGAGAYNSRQLPSARRPFTTAHLVISQVYGGGGNSGALYTNDFIELFNPSGSAVSFTNWSVQYASAAGSTWQVSVLTGTITLQPGHYFLIQEAAGAGGSQPLPMPDNIGSIQMNATAGKLALVNNSSPLPCGSVCHGDPSVVDYIGYGAANDFEGSGPAPAPGNNTSDVRESGGCTDTNDNSADFVTVTPPTPRNTSSPIHLCQSGTPTATVTSMPLTSTVLIDMLYAYGYTTGTIQSDEAVRLVNVASTPADIGEWQVRNEAGGAVTLPLTATIAAGQKLWIANTATGFRTYFGFNPDYEYGADTDPTVPQAAQTAGYAFADAGGAVQLYDSLNILHDTLVYGTGNAGTAGWSGLAVQYYLPPGQPTFGSDGRGQIFNRKLDEYTGAPVPDTNTKDDWAQDDDPAGTPTVTPVPGDRSNDDINGKKILHPGWALTDPAYEDMFFTRSFTDSNVTTQFLVDPDNGYQPVHNLIASASQVITIETYEWHQTALAQDILDARARGVRIDVIIDGNPCCSSPPRPDAETLWTAQEWEAAGIPVYFFSGDQATGSDIYRYNNTHAKIMVVDGRWVLTGSDNFSFSEMPGDDKSNGTAGARGMMFITDAPDVVAYTLRLIDFDFRPSAYPDVVEYPDLGATPPPGYSPTPQPDMAGYTPVKPTPLVVTETEQIEIVQSPDNDLRDAGSIIGLVNRAGTGDTIMVEQQYERKYWEMSTTDGPNPRLQAYIAAAQRGADVRILLDGFFEGRDCSSSTHNPATVAYINGFGLPNLQARVAAPASGAPVGTVTPTTGEIHNKMVLASIGGSGYSSITSVNGSANAAKLNREYGLQIKSNAGYNYFKNVFDYDWSVGYIPCGGATPVPTFTRTPAPGTGTATPTGSPPATTPTSCALQFSDVPPGSTFYTYIRCLACRGIVSGYSNGTFRPSANVTRGQIAKIVSNSAGFDDPPGGPIFQDVPPGSTFYEYVQRLATRGLISGYPCGGPGEPCGPGNLPYFRTNNNATRGQISKIVSNAAGFNDPPAGQLFQDVPPGSTFYDYVQRLASRDTMQGYPCGGPSEPCVPPANLPYFRPNNNATRGQTSKIVANTFFPGCRP